MAKRINGIGTFDNGALNLTIAKTRECGHHKAEGVGGSPEEYAARADVRRHAQLLADSTSKAVEVFANVRGQQAFVVDQLWPSATA